MKFILFATIFIYGVSQSTSSFEEQHPKLIHRFVRSQKECRYEKGPWEECDYNAGVQKRMLKLKSSRSASTCEQVKHIQRACKKNCRYSKGTWTECTHGFRNRIDTLKSDATSGCEPVRNITKACKEPCRYSKSDWSPCENGVKSKTLTLTSDGPSSCQATKLISKECRQANQRRQEKQRKRKNQEKVDVNQE